MPEVRERDTRDKEAVIAAAVAAAQDGATFRCSSCGISFKDDEARLTHEAKHQASEVKRSQPSVRSSTSAGSAEAPGTATSSPVTSSVRTSATQRRRQDLEVPATKPLPRRSAPAKPAAKRRQPIHTCELCGRRGIVSNAALQSHLRKCRREPRPDKPVASSRSQLRATDETPAPEDVIRECRRQLETLTLQARGAALSFLCATVVQDEQDEAGPS